MTKRGIRRLVAVVLVVAAATWVAALLGFASGFLSDDPPAVNPYATTATTSTTTAGPVITIVGQAFGGDTTGTVGDEVTVSNESASSHTWTARVMGRSTRGPSSPAGRSPSSSIDPEPTSSSASSTRR